LDDEDIIQEMRNGNDKLIKFLKRDRVKRLIDYITKMPESDDHKKGHKFPFIVNELFSLDNSKINEKFFNDEIIEDESSEKKDESDEEEECNTSNPLDDSKGSEEEKFEEKHETLEEVKSTEETNKEEAKPLED